MRPRGMPLGFKLWFGFIALFGVAVIAAQAWLAWQVVDAGPEGIGRAIGAAVRAYSEETR